MPTYDLFKKVLDLELEWLEKDIRITEEELKKENGKSRETELWLRRQWAQNERARFYQWMSQVRDEFTQMIGKALTEEASEET